MRRAPILLLAPLLLATVLLGTGCNSAGAHAVRTARAPYNEALVRTWNEQLLLNLVRLRYRDTPFFLEVDTLTTQYDFGGAVSAGGDAGGDADDVYSLGGAASVSESPTVVYKPLQGESFVTQLLEPISLDKVMLLTQSGWSIERVFRLTVNGIADIPNAPSTTGPTPDYTPEYEEFHCLLGLLRELQRERRLEVLAQPVDDAGGKAGEGTSYRFSLRLRSAEVEGADERVRGGVSGCFGGLDDRRARRVLEALTPNQDRDLLAGDPVATRSLMGALYYLSQAVEVPAEDAELVTPVAGWGSTMYDAYFSVRSGEPCRSRPLFVRVPYRGHLFCILDTDLASKSTFGLLAQLVSLQAGSEAGALAPRLTLGLN